MKIFLARIAFAVSVLLLLGFSALWVYSHFKEDIINWRPGQSSLVLHFISSHGSIGCLMTRGLGDELQPHRCSLTVYPDPPDFFQMWRSDGNLIYFAGFVLARPNWVPNRTGGVLIPVWFPLLLMMVLPGVALEIWIRAKYRRRRNRCVYCGYDLRASKDRCPECGLVIQKSG